MTAMPSGPASDQVLPVWDWPPAPGWGLRTTAGSLCQLGVQHNWALGL